MGKQQTESLKKQNEPLLASRVSLDADGAEEIAKSLRHLLADVFALYLKTKNFHWHMTGSHFRDYHLLLDDHGAQLFAMTDPIAERGRKIGGVTIRSIGDIARHQRISDDDEQSVNPEHMLGMLCKDNDQLTRSLRTTHELCDRFSVTLTLPWITV